MQNVEGTLTFTKKNETRILICEISMEFKKKRFLQLFGMKRIKGLLRKSKLVQFLTFTTYEDHEKNQGRCLVKDLRQWV